MMLTLASLGLTEARRALDRGIAEAEARGLLMAFVVADLSGDPIACQRMDGAPARNLTHALRKAYTAAVMGRDTGRFALDLAERGGNLEQWGDRRLTTLQGGRVVQVDGATVGAIACGGAPSAIDDEIAGLMVAAALG